MAQRRFIRRGVSKYFFAATVEDISEVERGEVSAAVDLSDYIADVAGWQLENNSVATPDMGSDFDSSIPGTDSVGDSSFTFYEDLDLETIEQLLPKGTEGFVIIMRKGDKPGSASMDVFPVRVASKGSEHSVGNDPARFMVRFNITSKPDLDQQVPAIPPSVTSVLPASGAAAGGTSVVIKGAGLSGATGATFGGASATNFTYVSATEVHCTTPAHAAGAVNVVVVRSGGNATGVNKYTYV